MTPAPAPEVNWQGCNLSGAVVYDADLSGANLSGANLTGAEITGSSDVTDANLSGATMTNTMLQADFSGSDLAGANLTDENDLRSSFTEADLHDVNLSGADLQPATLADVESGGITASPLPTLPTLWQLSSGYLTGPGGVDFDGQNLTGLALKNVSLSGSQFVGANLTDANLTNDNLADSDVQNADFTGVTWGAVESGGITGTPAELTAHCGIVAGYLIGRTRRRGRQHDDAADRNLRGGVPPDRSGQVRVGHDWPGSRVPAQGASDARRPWHQPGRRDVRMEREGARVYLHDEAATRDQERPRECLLAAGFRGRRSPIHFGSGHRAWQ